MLTSWQDLAAAIGDDVDSFVEEGSESVLQCVYHLPSRTVVYACVIALLHTRRTESTFSKHVVNTLSSDLEV